MARLLAVGLLLSAIAPAAPAAAQADVIRLLDEPLAGGVSVRVTQAPSGIGVAISRGPLSRGETTPPFADMAVQAWVLTADGSALGLAQRPYGQPISVWSGRLRGGGRVLSHRTFVFEHANPRDLAAVVVSLDGVLFVRPFSRATESVPRQP
jgi:hypothetical protein